MPAQVRWVHAVIRPAGGGGLGEFSSTLPFTSFYAPGYKVSKQLGVWEQLVEVPANTFQNKQFVHCACAVHCHLKTWSTGGWPDE